MDTSLIRSHSLFSGISEKAAQQLLEAMAPIHLRRGRVLFRFGERGDRLYFIKSGSIKLGMVSSDGRESLLDVLGRGEIIGELTLFDPGPRTATATAVLTADLLELSHADMVKWLAANPSAARHLLAALAHRLRRTDQSRSDLILTDVPGRVAKTLIDLAERFGELTGSGVHVTHGLTQEELAQLVGASRETVNKSLSEFVARGWVTLEGRGSCWLDLARLAERAR
ncbi:MAG: Crp/Fnr family transcriptional regulator [Micrococcales bacterium]|nr:Crp/Fnr family transcriptional regulator [Micrococcales bacterium]